MASPARSDDAQRKSMIAKVKIGQKQLGIDEGAYRAMLLRLTGQDSAAKCTAKQLALVLDEYKAKGWSQTAPRAAGPAQAQARAVWIDRRKLAASPMAKKARALWISLYQLGVVRDPAESALEAFAKRQLGVDRLQWADEGQAFRLVEGLKAMADRAGWSQVLTRAEQKNATEILKKRLLNAIRARLDLGPVIVPGIDLDKAIVRFADQLRLLGPRV
jgi:phage gp16-like protein